VDRQQLRAPGALTAIKFLRIQPQHIDAETDGALGEAGFGIEDKALRPLFSLALSIGRVDEVAVEVGVAQVQVDLGTFDKPASSACSGHRRAGQGHGDQTGKCVRRRGGCHSWGLSCFFKANGGAATGFSGCRHEQ
jgi:hypothetical protein